MNILKYLGLALAIANEVAAAEAQFETTGTVSAPGIRTYIGKEHVEVDVTIKKLA